MIMNVSAVIGRSSAQEMTGSQLGAQVKPQLSQCLNLGLIAMAGPATAATYRNLDILTTCSILEGKHMLNQPLVSRSA